MSQPTTPEWCEPPKDEPRRCFRFSQQDVNRSRSKGQKKGIVSRYALRNLPPVEEDEP
jgi:hypothetical protein